MAHVEHQGSNGVRGRRAQARGAGIRGVVPKQSTASAVQSLAAKQGVEKTAEMLGCGREGIARIAARLPVRAGTLALVEMNLVGLESAA